MTHSRLARALLNIAFAGIAGSLVCACGSTLLRVPRSDPPVGKPKTGLKLVVYDFADKTKGDNGLGWESGKSYDNVGAASADIIAVAMRDTGWFASVDRVPKGFDDAAQPAGSVSVAGEVTKFAGGGSPHWSVFINPICLFAL